MRRYILERLLTGVLGILAVSVIVFLLARVTGDPLDFILDPSVSEETRQQVAKSLGLDKPLYTQYGLFLANAVRGDFGQSLRGRRPALDMVLERFPATFQLAAAAIFVSILVALPLGVLSATRRGHRLDTAGQMIAVLGQSLPAFWVGIMLIWIVSVQLGLLPTSGYGGLAHMLLPGISLGWYIVAGIMRLTRSSMLDVLGTEYVKFHRIKGLSNWIVVWKHGLKNAAIPVITYTSIIFVGVLSGSVVTETVFAWPGVGRLAYESIVDRDFPVIQVIVLLMATMYILTNFAIDLLYVYLDPRIRYREPRI